MAIDTVTIFNQALSLVGTRCNVALPSENSREAEECRLHFETIRDQILASAAWPEATKVRALSLLSADEDGEWTSGEPRSGYTYSYAMPSDCVRPQYLTTFNRFQIATRDDDVRVLMTNESTPILVYTFRQQNVTMWSSELFSAVKHALAAAICIPLTGKRLRAKDLAEQANNMIIAARESAANTDDQQYEVLPDWIAARGYNDTSVRTRYYYPFGSMLTVANG